MRVAALVLAAGAGSRFGGGKMLAMLEGRPLLQHVLDTVAQLGPDATVVVLGDDSADVEAAIAWHGEQRVRNPYPERGLASSLQVGIATLDSVATDPRSDAALVLLGDQPRVRVDVMRALVEAAEGSHLPFVVPRYDGGGNPNPVLVRREGWAAVASLTGDRGLGLMITSHPDLRLEVPVSGTNPDVDSRADLEELSST